MPVCMQHSDYHHQGMGGGCGHTVGMLCTCIVQAACKKNVLVSTNVYVAILLTVQTTQMIPVDLQFFFVFVCAQTVGTRLFPRM